MIVCVPHVAVLAVWALALPLTAGAGKNVAISEVADKGSDGVCDGEDWVELWNRGEAAVDLAGYQLADDKGFGDTDAYTFPEGSTVAGSGFVVLCGKATFQFGIGGTDTVSLQDASGLLVDETMLEGGGAFGVTWAFFDDGGFAYTATATAGAQNVKASLATTAAPMTPVERTALGDSFFGATSDGYPLENSSHVVDIRLTMEESVLESMYANSSHEQFVKVDSFTYEDQGIRVTLPSPVRIRPSGFSTLLFAECQGHGKLPFKLDFAHYDASQQFFGLTEA